MELSRLIDTADRRNVQSAGRRSEPGRGAIVCAYPVATTSLPPAPAARHAPFQEHQFVVSRARSLAALFAAIVIGTFAESASIVPLVAG